MEFANIKNLFGFGCMRLKMVDDQVDYQEFSKMVDSFMNEGFTYFDTARVYLDGKSEIALRECLVKRYPRDSFTLTDKLSNSCWEKEADIKPFFYSQLESLGVDYLDFYLFHALNRNSYEKYKREHAFEVVKQLKEEGKIKHIGLSFHDQPEILDKILTEQKDIIEVVQIQFNYLDLDNPGVKSQECYNVCVKHNLPIIVMEPIKGGTLVNLPKEALDLLKECGQGSPASYALRFVASHPQIFMILSGMGSKEQMDDNLTTMKHFVPFNEKEFETINKVRKILIDKHSIPCTTCHYCTPGCPMQIKIPEIFTISNSETLFHSWHPKRDYEELTLDSAKASACIKCGQCEAICPQHLPIIKLLEDIAKKYE